jgi:hypothetical protein
MTILKGRVFNVFLKIIIVFLGFSFYFSLNLVSGFARCDDTDFGDVQRKYDQYPDFFSNNLWLYNIRGNPQIQVRGGQVGLDSRGFLILNPIVVSLISSGCDFQGVRIILKDCNQNELGRTTINQSGVAVFNIPQNYERYPLQVLASLLAKSRSVDPYSNNIITDLQLRSYLRQSEIRTSNINLFKSLLFIWINDARHANQNIFNRMSDLLQFANNDAAKRAVICSNKTEILNYISGIDEVDRNNPSFLNFNNRLNCLFD